MKTLSDGTEVSARSYYYLLDFNDRDGWKTLVDEFNKTKLGDLTIAEYIKLFRIATKRELKSFYK
jgi:hypothetical protein